MWLYHPLKIANLGAVIADTESSKIVEPRLYSIKRNTALHLSYFGTKCDRYNYVSHMVFSYLYFDGNAEVIPPPMFNAQVNSVVKVTTCRMWVLCRTHNFLIPLLKPWQQPSPVFSFSPFVHTSFYTSHNKPHIRTWNLRLIWLMACESKCTHIFSVTLTRYFTECL